VRLASRVLSAAVLAVALLQAPPLVAQGPAEGKWWKRPRIAKQLDLSADQVAQLEKIFARSKPKLIDLRADFEKKQFDYDQAMQNDDVDRDTLEAKIEAREQARAALQKELALMELDMKKILNPEQREKLVEMREKARALVQERRRRMRDSAVDDGLGESDAAPPARRDQRVATPKPRR
jgi:Spy/CpxP family protein refolding chaperone